MTNRRSISGVFCTWPRLGSGRSQTSTLPNALIVLPLNCRTPSLTDAGRHGANASARGAPRNASRNCMYAGVGWSRTGSQRLPARRGVGNMEKRYGILYRNQGTSFPGRLDPRPRGSRSAGLDRFRGNSRGDEARLMHWATAAWQAARDPYSTVGGDQRQVAFARRPSPFQGVPNLGAELLFASSAQAYVVLAIDPWARQSAGRVD